MADGKRRETGKHLEAFEAWYAANRDFRKISQNLALPARTLYDWADRYEWHERADARDKAAQKLADDEAAKKKAERAKRRRQAAELLTLRGREFLAVNKLSDERSAIQAIKYGLENERKEDGIPDWVAFILNADQNALEAMGKSFGLALPDGEDSGDGDGLLSPESDAEDEE